MLKSRHQITGQTHYVEVANKSFENVQFRYFWTTILGFRGCEYEDESLQRYGDV
jgi:hypothetical protein